MVEKIEVYKGGASSRYGADALAGAVNIITHPRTISDETMARAKDYLGTWDSDIFSFSLKNPLILTNLATNLAYTYQFSKGDFEYDDPKKGTSTRENAYKRGYNFFLSGLYSFSPVSRLSFSAQLYRSTNGIPGAVYQLNKSAKFNDSRELMNLKFEKELSRKFSFETRFGFSHFIQEFKSTEDRIRYDTKYVDDILDFAFLLELNLLPKNRLELGAELKKDMLDHQDFLRPQQSMGKITRQTSSFFISQSQVFKLPGCLFLNDLNLNLSLRHDDSKELEDFTSPQIGITLARGIKSKIILRGNYWKSYRQPSNNALFWNEDVWSAGNPDLLPEKSENYELGGEVKFPLFSELNLRAGITFFHSFIWDVIVWRRRFDGRYMPVNISRAKITGHEDFIRFSLFDDKIEINYQNTVTQALNKSGDRIYDGKFIPFRPRYVTNLEYRLSYWILLFSHRLRWVSQRYTLEANTKKEEPYHLEDINFGIKKRVSRWEVKFNVQIKNLTNEEYILIQNHPMPGREWGVSLEIIYGLRKR
jgi:outer membrane cobalamin receptor